MPDNLLAYVLGRLPEKGSPHYLAQLEQIATGSGVALHTLIKIANGQTVDPRVNTVQRLFDYFRDLERREAA